MQTKTVTIEAMDEAGKGLVRIATLSAVDLDDDTYEPGAFTWKEGGHQWCSILPAHHRGKVPLGKARVYEEGDAALAEVFFNLAIPEAKSWHSAIMFDLAQGKSVQEYSYSFDMIDFDYQARGNNRVRVIKRVDVHEISPVLKGAGIGTGTIVMKGAKLKEEHFASLIGWLSELAGALPADPTSLSATGLKQLGEIHAAIGATLKTADAKEACQECSGEFDPKDLADGVCADCAGEKAARSATDQALAGYLELQSRPHLAPPA